MKSIITILIFAVISIGVFANEKSLNKQIAVLESKVFALQTENKNLKKELEKKNKAITALAMKLADKPALTTTRPAVTRNHYSRTSSYDPAKAANIAAEQQKKERARQLAVINKKIAYYKKRKATLEKEYEKAEKQLKEAKYLIGKSTRQNAIELAQKKQKKIKKSISYIEDNISSLEKQAFNYQ